MSLNTQEIKTEINKVENEIKQKISEIENSYESEWYNYYSKTFTHKLKEFLNDTWATKIERKVMERILKERGAL